MFSDRVQQLESVSISDLIQDIFKKPVDIVDLGHHDDLRNYVIKVDNKFILKIYGDKDSWQREVQNLIRMKKSSFKTPYLVDYGMVNPYNGWTLLNVLPGQVMTECYAKMSLTNREKLWYHLGVFLSDFHINNMINYNDIIFFETKTDIKHRKSYWEYIIDKYNHDKEKIINNQYYQQPLIYQTVFNDIECWLTDIKTSDSSMFVLCHNDFCLRNILYDKAQDSFSLIDFEMGVYGQPEADFARILLDLIREGFTDAFFDGYFGTNKIIKKNTLTIHMNLLLKIVEICSWAHNRSYEYYVNTFDILKKIYNRPLEMG